MKHVHHDMIIEWAKDTSQVVQRYYGGGVWLPEQYPQWYKNDKYRFKPAEPKYIVVNGVNVPEPVREPLECGQEYWLAGTSVGGPCVYHWDGSFSDRCWLPLGLIHLTREAAQAHIDAMLAPSRTDK